jgi:hypothetical protein
MSQVTATVRPVGADCGHTSVAVFGGARLGFEFTDVTCPVVPPPEQCPSFRDPLPEGVVGFPPASFWERLESRPAVGHAPWDQWEPTSSERVHCYRFDDPPVTEAGDWDPFALVALCDTMPGAVGERMGPGLPRWFGPSADLTVHILGNASAPWLLGHHHARHVGDGYGSVEMELWDPARGLVAYATQMLASSTSPSIHKEGDDLSASGWTVRFQVLADGCEQIVRPGGWPCRTSSLNDCMAPISSP